MESGDEVGVEKWKVVEIRLGWRGGDGDVGESWRTGMEGGVDVRIKEEVEGKLG